MHRVLVVIAVSLALTEPARAAAIFIPIFTALLTAAGAATTVTVVGVTINVAAVLSAITVAAIGFGLTMLLAKKPKAPQAEDGAVPVQQALPFRTFGYGTTRIAGAVMMKEEVSGRLCVVQALFGHLIAQVQQIFMNDDQVSLTGTEATLTGVKSGYVAVGTDRRYGLQYAAIDTRLGLDTETYYPHIGVINTVEGETVASSNVWGSSHRGDRIASLMMVCTAPSQEYFSTTFPYGPPQPSAVCDTAFLFDPRDVSHDPDNPSTWTFSRNPVLAMLHFQCFSDYGFQRPYAKAILPVVDRWIQAANDCDAFVAKKSGGTERRYQMGIWISAEQDRKAAVQAILAACDGWMCTRGDGTIVMEVGVYRDPVVTITDADIVGFKLQTDIPSAQRINQSTARYTSPDNNYVTVETTPRLDVDDQAIRPGPPRAAVLDLTAVQSTGQASRLHKRETIRQQARTSGVLILRWSALDACYTRRVRVQSNTIPRLGNVVIENRRPSISAMDQTCSIEFMVLGDEIDEYDPLTDESAPPVIPAKPNSALLEPPEGIEVVAVQITDGGGVSTIILQITFPDPFDGMTSPPQRSWVVRWRELGTQSWTQQEFSGVSPVAGEYTLQTGVVMPESILEVSVAAKSGSSLSEWSSPAIEVETSPEGVAPDMPTDFTATGGVGVANLECTLPLSAGVVSAQFYRAAVGVGFGLASPIGAPVAGAPGSVCLYTDTASAGSYDYFVVALNSYGTPSNEAGPETTTIT
mgnify:CR=1 FL=1